MKLVATGAIAMLAAAFIAPTASAQNVDAMAKWTSLTVVHDKVVGEFNGLTTIVISSSHGDRKATVTDRVELEFDWNQTEMKLVGTPVIRNSPTKVVSLAPVTGCPETKVNGPFEFATALALTNHTAPGILELSIKRDHPLGAICWVSEVGPSWDNAPAKSATSPMALTVPAAMALAVPGMGMTTPDGKSLLVKGSGWTWTYTPTPVK